MKFIRRLFSWFRSSHQLSEEIQRVDDSISVSHKQTKAILEGIRESQQMSDSLLLRLTSFSSESEVLYERALEHVQAVKAENLRLEAQCRALQEELDTITTLTIPGLVASHKALISRWEAEVQVQASLNKSIQQNQS